MRRAPVLGSVLCFGSNGRRRFGSDCMLLASTQSRQLSDDSISIVRSKIMSVSTMHFCRMVSVNSSRSEESTKNIENKKQRARVADIAKIGNRRKSTD